MPFFSVIIPLYNKEKYIKKTIESILNQDFQDFEIIIINDGSTDASEEIVKNINDPRIKLYSQPNKGVSTARNKGIEIAKGQIIAFLDADDYWFPNHLQEIHNLSLRFPDTNLFATGYENLFTSGLIKKRVLNKNKQYLLLKPFYKYAQRWPLFYTSNFAVKKKLFEKEEAFKKHIHAEDTELFLRLGHRHALAYASTISMQHKKEAQNSLFASYNTHKKTLILSELKELEKKDSYLKSILDQNRFSWILEYKMNGEQEQANKLVRQIDKQNLNIFQKILLKLPGHVLKLLKHLQQKLIKQRIYLTPFSKK
jgi:glycosyltransferase involved in cell wall biosynthesis